MDTRKGVSPTRMRSKLVKACLDAKYSGNMILELLDRVNEVSSDAEREKRAEEILREIEEIDAKSAGC